MAEVLEGENASPAIVPVPSNLVMSVVPEITSRIENLIGDMETLKGEHMAACKAIREDIRDVITEAVDRGVDKRMLKELLKVRATKRALEKRLADLDRHETQLLGDYLRATGTQLELDI